MSRINPFLTSHAFPISTNPCISPDFCLNWAALSKTLKAGGAQGLRVWEKSAFQTESGSWLLAEDPASGDCVWLHRGEGVPRGVAEGVTCPDGATAYPASFANLLALKNLIQEKDPESTLFPTAGGNLGVRTLGVGARFTTLHWPAVEWAMSALGVGMTANQNSIPRELVYDVDAMLEGKLDSVPFPFIGTNVPEGHQGQSVEGMSHGCVLSKLKTGFHRRRIAWSFNADHQPIGGKFDVREDALVKGCVLASYITFDLSPELAQTALPADPQAWVAKEVPAALIKTVQERVTAAGLSLNPEEFAKLLAQVWPSMRKMKVRDEKYRAARHQLFTTAAGRTYLRELSIDELPGLTTPETTAVMLALCEALDMKIHFIAPAFGFQKNMPYPDQAELRRLIQRQWEVCSRFGVSIGFHSGSGKSAENYQVMGDVTGCRLEIKTSGRYTYEMGRALHQSAHPGDSALWRDWYDFTRKMAVAGAFSADPTERRMARTFVDDALRLEGIQRSDTYASPETLAAVLGALKPNPEHMFWFEYNFLFVLAADGRAEKAALGDHTEAGYRQRSRFYSISDEGRLNYLRNVARYLVFLARNTGLVDEARCAGAEKLLERYTTVEAFLRDISN